ncbi:MAG: hypothetical protein R3E02_02360 [Blastomonas sp.]
MMKACMLAALPVLCAALLSPAAHAGEAGADPESAEPAYKIDVSWPRAIPNNWLIGDVSSVSVDRHDHIWILHRPERLSPRDTQAGASPPTAKCCIAAPPVIEFDAEGNMLRAWGGPDQVEDWFDTPHGIFVDDEDNVWLVGAGPKDGLLLKFSSDGELLLRIGQKGAFLAADDPAMLGKPSDIHVDTARREVFVSDGYRNQRVIVYDADSGAFKRQWTAFGRTVNPGHFNVRDEDDLADDVEHGQHVDPLEKFSIVHCVAMIDGEIHVCDRTNSRVQIFTPDGKYLREIFFNRELGGLTGSTWDVAARPGHPDQMLVLDGSNSEIAVLDRHSGEVIASYLSKGHFIGQMHWPHQLAADRHGRLYIAEVSYSGRIQRFVPNMADDTVPEASLTATYIPKEDIDRVNSASPGGDRNIRVVDIGHENFALGVVHRGRTVDGVQLDRMQRSSAPAPACGRTGAASADGGRKGGIIHDGQTEAYYILSGGGTMFTDGYLTNGRHLELAELNGPTCIGTAHDSMVRAVKPGDVVIVPAGVVHGWVDVPDHVDYLSFRPSPDLLTAGWVNPALAGNP